MISVRHADQMSCVSEFRMIFEAWVFIRADTDAPFSITELAVEVWQPIPQWAGVEIQPCGLRFRIVTEVP